jgi:hypothetical protein
MAAMQVQGLTTILTFDKTGFSRRRRHLSGPFDKTFTQQSVLAGSGRSGHALPPPPLSA